MANLTLSSVLGPHWNSNPSVAAWNTCLAQVISDINSNLASSQVCTVSINFDYGFCNGQAMPGGAVGQSQWFVNTKTYSAIRTAYQALSQNSLQTTAYNNTNFPSTDIFGGGETIQSTLALQCATALGAPISNNFTVGFVGISSSHTIDSNSTGSSCAGGAYSLYGTLMHEITEVLGRACNVGAGGTDYYFGDLFSYSSAGTRNFTTSASRYASTDGTTSILGYNQNGAGDFGDTDQTPILSAFDAFATQGFAPSRGNQPLQSNDWQLMTLLGWQLSPTGLINGGLTSGGAAGGLSPALIGAHGR